MSRANLLFVALLAAVLSACATPREDPLQQAIEDFVAVSELEASNEIRHRDQLHYDVLNDHHVIMHDRKNSYLVRFTRRCVELRDNFEITPDVRYDARILRAKFDTIRGCRIEAIYPVNEGQVEELKSLGDAPGATL